MIIFIAIVVINKHNSYNLPYDAIAPKIGLILNNILKYSSCSMVYIIEAVYCIKKFNLVLALDLTTLSLNSFFKSLGS